MQKYDLGYKSRTKKNFRVSSFGPPPRESGGTPRLFSKNWKKLLKKIAKMAFILAYFQKNLKPNGKLLRG